MTEGDKGVRRAARRQWGEIEIPEAAYLQVRNGTWNCLSSPEAPRDFRLVYALCALVLVLTVVFVFQLSEPAALPPSAVVSLPTSLDRNLGRQAPMVEPETDAVRSSEASLSSQLRVEKVDSSVEMADARKVISIPADEEIRHKRVVMNFRLPESGVRMIWIQDSQFGLAEGETDED